MGCKKQQAEDGTLFFVSSWSDDPLLCSNSQFEEHLCKILNRYYEAMTDIYPEK